MVYLTPDGRDPSDDSRGTLDNEEVIKISYQNPRKPRKSTQPWLKDCHNRAFNNLELQVAIKQYRRIVETLTENGLKEPYMNDLLNLLKKNNNVQLFIDLQTTLNEAWPNLMKKFWEEIENELYDFHPDVRDNIEKLFDKHNEIDGLGIPIENAKFCVKVENRIFFGVKCSKDSKEKLPDNYDKYYKALHELGYSENSWPVWRYREERKQFSNQNSEVVAMLLNDKERKDFVSETVKQVKDLWDQINQLYPIKINITK